MKNIEKINAEMKIAGKTCPQCRMPLRSQNVVGIGIHFVDCQANGKRVKEPMSFYVVRCPLCRLRGTCDSLMNKDDVVETISKAWDEMNRIAWLTYEGCGMPSDEFIEKRNIDSLDRFFTFTRDAKASKTTNPKKEHSDVPEMDK